MTTEYLSKPSRERPHPSCALQAPSSEHSPPKLGREARPSACARRLSPSLPTSFRSSFLVGSFSWHRPSACGRRLSPSLHTSFRSSFLVGSFSRHRPSACGRRVVNSPPHFVSQSNGGAGRPRPRRSPTTGHFVSQSACVAPAFSQSNRHLVIPGSGVKMCRKGWARRPSSGHFELIWKLRRAVTFS